MLLAPAPLSALRTPAARSWMRCGACWGFFVLQAIGPPSGHPSRGWRSSQVSPKGFVDPDLCQLDGRGRTATAAARPRPVGVRNSAGGAHELAEARAPFARGGGRPVRRPDPQSRRQRLRRVRCLSTIRREAALPYPRHIGKDDAAASTMSVRVAVTVTTQAALGVAVALCRVALLACAGASVHRTVPTQCIGGRSRSNRVGRLRPAGSNRRSGRGRGGGRPS